MQQAAAAPGRSNFLPWLAFFLLVVGTRLLLVAYYGTETPMEDEWGSEAHLLYLPWVHGSLKFADLFALWNEHRIFTTRLYELAMLFLGGGVWSPIEQMVGNALVQGITFTGLTALLMRACPAAYRQAFFLLSLILWGLPLAVENVLVGFQTQIYLLIFFSYAFLWALVVARRFSLGWWLGIASGVLSVYSMASGELALLCGAAFLVYRGFRERDMIDLVLAALLTMVAASFIILTPTIPDVQRAHTLLDFGIALLRVTSWPALPGFFLIIYLPLLRFVWSQLRRPPAAANDSSWFVFLLALWALVQLLAIAFSRANMPLVSRYNDFFVIGLVINFLCTLRRDQRLAEVRAAQPEAERAAPPYMPFSQLWILVVMAGTLYYCNFLFHELNKKMEWAPLPEQNIRLYLSSRDFAVLDHKEFPDLPFHDQRLLQTMLDDPLMDAILPTNLVSANVERQPWLWRQVLAHLSGLAIGFMAVGALCLALALSRPGLLQEPAEQRA